MKKILFTMTVVASLIVGCQDPNEDTLFVQPTNIESEMSTTTILEKSPETYSLWIEMLKYTDYYNALKDANASATVFSPNNEAIKRFLADRGVSTIEELDLDYARKVVQNHIIDWEGGQPEVSDSSLVNDATAGEYIHTRNLFNQYITLSYGYTITDVDDDQRTDIVYSPDSIFLNNQAKLGRFVGQSGSNGNIYMMDDVIVPNAENIVERLDNLDGDNNTFRIFTDAIMSDPEILHMATTERDTTTGQGGVQVINTYSYTCFAVPDHIMNESGITDVESLKQWLVNNSDGEETNPDSALNHYLKYHFMPSQYTMDEVYNLNDPSETLIYDTKYTGQAFTVQLVDNKRTINTGIPILRSDIQASNGLITKIGGIMPVYHPTPVNVRWDFLNSADIISFVNNWGAANREGDFFSSALTNSYHQVDLSEERYDGEYGEITSFTANLTETSTSSGSYRRIAFMKERAATGQPNTPEHGAYMNNYLILNLGFAGWIEFNTPTIIAGKYKVVLHYIKDPLLATLYTSGTLTQFNIDDEDYQTLAYLYRGQSMTMPFFASIEETLWNSVEFEGSSQHKFRITMRDINAKNLSSYHQRLDYVEFIPIE